MMMRMSCMAEQRRGAQRAVAGSPGDSARWAVGDRRQAAGGRQRAADGGGRIVHAHPTAAPKKPQAQSNAARSVQLPARSMRGARRGWEHAARSVRRMVPLRHCASGRHLRGGASGPAILRDGGAADAPHVIQGQRPGHRHTAAACALRIVGGAAGVAGACASSDPPRCDCTAAPPVVRGSVRGGEGAAAPQRPPPAAPRGSNLRQAGHGTQSTAEHEHGARTRGSACAGRRSDSGQQRPVPRGAVLCGLRFRHVQLRSPVRAPVHACALALGRRRDTHSAAGGQIVLVCHGAGGGARPRRGWPRGRRCRRRTKSRCSGAVQALSAAPPARSARRPRLLRRPSQVTAAPSAWEHRGHDGAPTGRSARHALHSCTSWCQAVASALLPGTRGQRPPPLTPATATVTATAPSSLPALPAGPWSDCSRPPPAPLPASGVLLTWVWAWPRPPRRHSDTRLLLVQP